MFWPYKIIHQLRCMIKNVEKKYSPSGRTFTDQINVFTKGGIIIGSIDRRVSVAFDIMIDADFLVTHKFFEVILEHGDTLFMPAGCWHHMEYLESGFAMSLRALQPTITGKLKGVWNLFGMRGIDTMMKKTAPKWWYENKIKKLFENADREMERLAG